MSIACIHLDRAIQFTEADVLIYKQKPHRLQGFAHGLVQAASTNNRYKDIASDIANIVFLIGDAYHMGKCNLSPVTSQWVKEKYPNATHELFVTIISNENANETHVLIFYFP